MLDLETLATSPRAVVLSLGGVKFDPYTNDDPFDPIYIKFEIEKQTDILKRDVEEGTLDWWAKQNAAVRDEAFNEEGRIDLETGLTQVRKWLSKSGRLWGHGYGFDYTILGTLYQDTGNPIPWAYWQIMDSRTMFNLMPKDPRDKNANLHNPLADSDNQAKAVQKAFTYFKQIQK